MDWLGPLISAIALVLVAIIEAVATRERKRYKADRERAERRAALRAKESQLSMEMMSANNKLTLIIAKKLTGQHTNGDVEEAMHESMQAQRDYQDFLEEQQQSKWQRCRNGRPCGRPLLHLFISFAR